MDWTSHTDAELAASAGTEGNMEALSILLERHAPAVHRTICAMAPWRNDAEDLTQQTLIRAARGIRGFQGRASFPTWLHRIAVNTVRSQLARGGPEFVPAAEEVEPAAPRTAHPDVRAQAGEIDRHIGRALAALPEPFREAAALMIVQQMPAREAARAAGCLAATMYWRVFRARELLQEELREFIS